MEECVQIAGYAGKMPRSDFWVLDMQNFYKCFVWPCYRRAIIVHILRFAEYEHPTPGGTEASEKQLLKCLTA